MDSVINRQTYWVRMLGLGLALVVSAIACNLYGADDDVGSRFAVSANDIQELYQCVDSALGSGEATNKAQAYAICSRARSYRWDLMLEAGLCSGDPECALYVAAIQTGDIDQLAELEDSPELTVTATQQPVSELQFNRAESSSGWCFFKPETDLVPGQTCGYTLELELGYPPHPAPTVISCTVSFAQIEPDQHELVSQVLNTDGGTWEDAFELGGRYETMERQYVETIECAHIEWNGGTGQDGAELTRAGSSYYLDFTELR